MSYIVLARKYRPNCLDELTGQVDVKKTITQIFEDKTIPHAFILFGIRGVGKTTIARIIAKGLNCETSITINPCNTCSSCVSLNENRHLDILELDAASKTGVDDMREIIESSKYKPVQGRYKVFIIDEVHMLSKSAFNALLKTLEEPPPHVKFIFATTEIKKIPDTILSRCLKLELSRISPNVLIDRLKQILKNERKSATDEALKLIARSSEGSLRDAISLLDQAIFLSKASKKSILEDTTVREMLGSSDKDSAFLTISYLFNNDTKSILEIKKSDPIMFLQDILDVIYAVSCLQNGHLLVRELYTEEEFSKIQHFAQSFEKSFVLRTWNLLIEGYQEVSRSPMPNQSLDMLLLRCCFIKTLPSIEDLIKNQNSDVKNFLTFNDLVNELSKKEPVLCEKVKKGIEIIQYDFGKIVISYKSDLALKTPLINALKILTSIDWVIEVHEELGMDSIQHIEDNILVAQKNNVMESNTVKNILKEFPKAEVAFVEDDTSD